MADVPGFPLLTTTTCGTRRRLRVRRTGTEICDFCPVWNEMETTWVPWRQNEMFALRGITEIFDFSNPEALAVARRQLLCDMDGDMRAAMKRFANLRENGEVEIVSTKGLRLYELNLDDADQSDFFLKQCYFKRLAELREYILSLEGYNIHNIKKDVMFVVLESRDVCKGFWKKGMIPSHAQIFQGDNYMVEGPVWEPDDKCLGSYWPCANCWHFRNEGIPEMRPAKSQ